MLGEPRRDRARRCRRAHHALPGHLRSAVIPDLVWTSVTDLARMIATKEVSPVEVVRAHLARIDRLDAHAARVHHRVRRRGARGRAGGRGGARGGADARAAARRADRAEGSRRHARRPHDRGLEHPRGPRAGHGRHRRRAAPRGGRDRPRQAQHARVRVRPGRAQRALRARRATRGTRRSHARRRAARRRAPASPSPPGSRAGGARLRHRRLDPDPGLALRDHRAQADVRPGEPRRRAAARVVDRPRRPDGAERGRLRADARGDRRLRPRAIRRRSVLPVPDYAAALDRRRQGPARRACCAASFVEASGPDGARGGRGGGARRSRARARSWTRSTLPRTTWPRRRRRARGRSPPEALAYHADWMRTRPRDYQRRRARATLHAVRS